MWILVIYFGKFYKDQQKIKKFLTERRATDVFYNEKNPDLHDSLDLDL